jgi:hypothetical protein
MFPVGVIPGTRFPVTPRIVTPFLMFPAWMFESIELFTALTDMFSYPTIPAIVGDLNICAEVVGIIIMFFEVLYLNYTDEIPLYPESGITVLV